MKQSVRAIPDCSGTRVRYVCLGADRHRHAGYGSAYPTRPEAGVHLSGLQHRRWTFSIRLRGEQQHHVGNRCRFHLRQRCLQNPCGHSGSMAVSGHTQHSDSAVPSQAVVESVVRRGVPDVYEPGKYQHRKYQPVLHRTRMQDFYGRWPRTGKCKPATHSYTRPIPSAVTLTTADFRRSTIPTLFQYTNVTQYKINNRRC